MSSVEPHAIRLYGRDKAVPLTRDFLSRDPGSHRGGVIFVGPGGNGKTALLDGLTELLAKRFPYARIDCASAMDGSVPRVLAALAFELNRRCDAYGRLSFPRLIVGQLIIAEPKVSVRLPAAADRDKAPVAEADRAQARAKVEKVLDGYHDSQRLQSFLRVLSRAALPAIGGQLPGLTQLAEPLANLLMDGLVDGLSRRIGRRVTAIGRAAAWYGNTWEDAVDVLIDLNVNHHEGRVDRNRRWVDERLLDAFLADLQEAFGRGKAAKGAANAAVLVDNADARGGPAFLEEFAAATRRHFQGTGQAAPVTAIATSRGEFAARVARGDQPYVTLDEADGVPADPWLPVWLPNLTRRQVGDMAQHAGVTGDHVPEMIYRFTHGHPGSTARLLQAIPQDSAVAIGELLDACEKPGDPTLEKRLLDELERGLDDLQRELLVTVSAARNKKDAERLFLGFLSKQNMPLVLDMYLWRPTDGGSAELPPVLRHLLWRCLAQGKASETADWKRTHRRLRPTDPWERLSRPDKTRYLYHTLALGDVATVARCLAEALPSWDTDPWLTLVKEATAAPRRSPITAETTKRAQELADIVQRRDTDPEFLGDVAMLVAALWIAADPFTGERRGGLHNLIERQYAALAGNHVQDRDVLIRQAAWHREEARLWPS